MISADSAVAPNKIFFFLSARSMPKIQQNARHHARKAKTIVESFKVTASANNVAATIIRAQWGRLPRLFRLPSAFPFLRRTVSNRIPAPTRLTIAAGSSLSVPTIFDRVAHDTAGIAIILQNQSAGDF